MICILRCRIVAVFEPTREGNTMSDTSVMPPPEDSDFMVRVGKIVVISSKLMRGAVVGTEPIRLTGKEFDVLESLARSAGKTKSKGQILDDVYPGLKQPELKIIDIFVCKLRKKLVQATGGDHYIETIWGKGYAFREPAIAETVVS
jgi:two-component system cell cycle response regulator CtrA